MRKLQSPVWGPLFIFLVFGLVINLVPGTAALGETVPACSGKGNSTSTARVVLGGEVVTPALLVRAVGNQPCDGSENSLNLVSLARTVIVSPNGSPDQNGQALLNALTVISQAAPSANNPWLLKLEPGNYFLGNRSLNMLSYVDLEGSGEGTTVISSSLTLTTTATGTLTAASNSEVRFVKVANLGVSDVSSLRRAVYVPANATNSRFVHVTAVAMGGLTSYGFFSDSTFNVSIQDSTIQAIRFVDSNSYGLYINAPGTVAVQNTPIYSYGALGGANLAPAAKDDARFAVISDYGMYGVYNNGGQLSIQNSSVTAYPGYSSYGLYNTDTGTLTFKDSSVSTYAGTYSYAFDNAGGTATIQNSNIQVGTGKSNRGVANSGSLILQSSAVTITGGAILDYGLDNSGTAWVVNSSLATSGGLNDYGAFNNGVIKIQNSVLSGRFGLGNVSGSDAKVGNSQLAGGQAASTNLTVCPNSYNANFVPLNSSCQ